MADLTYPLFPIFAFLGFFLVLLPLPWHLQAWNSATCYFMIWTALACLNQFINSIVWFGNAINKAPIWCDISTRIILAASVGIPAASLCINRRLYVIATVQTARVSRGDKRKDILIDTLLCVVFPLLVLILAYVVQGHRFNIVEDIGCATATYNTLLAYFLVTWWPLVLGVVSAVFCVLSLTAFAKRRAQFNALLSSSNSSLTFGRYFRLMALATTELMLTIPLSSYIIYLNVTTQSLGPWISWANTHYGFSRVDQIPALLWRQNHQFVIAVELGRWIDPACAFIFFAYFGFADEARRHYKQAFWSVASRLGFSKNRKSRDMLSLPTTTPPALKSRFSDTDTLPSYSAPSPPPLSRIRPRPGSLTLSILKEKPNYIIMPSSADSKSAFDHKEAVPSPTTTTQSSHDSIYSSQPPTTSSCPSSHSSPPPSSSFSTPSPSFSTPSSSPSPPSPSQQPPPSSIFSTSPLSSLTPNLERITPTPTRTLTPRSHFSRYPSDVPRSIYSTISAYTITAITASTTPDRSSFRSSDYAPSMTVSEIQAMCDASLPSPMLSDFGSVTPHRGQFSV